MKLHSTDIVFLKQNGHNVCGLSVTNNNNNSNVHKRYTLFTYSAISPPYSKLATIATEEAATEDAPQRHEHTQDAVNEPKGDVSGLVWVAVRLHVKATSRVSLAGVPLNVRACAERPRQEGEDGGNARQ